MRPDSLCHPPTLGDGGSLLRHLAGEGMKLTPAEWAALPEWQAVTNQDGSRLLAYYTTGRWPRFTFAEVEIIPNEEATGPALTLVVVSKPGYHKHGGYRKPCWRPK